MISRRGLYKIKGGASFGRRTLRCDYARLKQDAREIALGRIRVPKIQAQEAEQQPSGQPGRTDTNKQP